MIRALCAHLRKPSPSTSVNCQKPSSPRLLLCVKASPPPSRSGSIGLEDERRLAVLPSGSSSTPSSPCSWRWRRWLLHRRRRPRQEEGPSAQDRSDSFHPGLWWHRGGCSRAWHVDTVASSGEGHLLRHQSFCRRSHSGHRLHPHIAGCVRDPDLLMSGRESLAGLSVRGVLRDGRRYRDADGGHPRHRILQPIKRWQIAADFIERSHEWRCGGNSRSHPWCRCDAAGGFFGPAHPASCCFSGKEPMLHLVPSQTLSMYRELTRTAS